MSKFPSINVENHSDEELAALFGKNNDMEILGMLYKRYIDLVYGVSLKYLKNREDAKDAVMEIFEHISTALARHEVRNFKSWLHVSTRNHCLMKLRAAKNQNFSEINEEIFMEIPDAMNHNDEKSAEDELDKLEYCIETLKNEQKTCIELFYLKHKSYQEIESQTRFPLSKVKSFIQNGKRNLKICMEN